MTSRADFHPDSDPAVPFPTDRSGGLLMKALIRTQFLTSTTKSMGHTCLSIRSILLGL